MRCLFFVVFFPFSRILSFQHSFSSSSVICASLLISFLVSPRFLTCLFFLSFASFLPFPLPLSLFLLCHSCLHVLLFFHSFFVVFFPWPLFPVFWLLPASRLFLCQSCFCLGASFVSSSHCYPQSQLSEFPLIVFHQFRCAP